MNNVVSLEIIIIIIHFVAKWLLFCVIGQFSVCNSVYGPKYKGKDLSLSFHYAPFQVCLVTKKQTQNQNLV